jgi:hypothetical protein
MIVEYAVFDPSFRKVGLSYSCPFLPASEDSNANPLCDSPRPQPPRKYSVKMTL